MANLVVNGTLNANKLIIDGEIFEVDANKKLSIKTNGIQADLVAFKDDTFEKFTNVDNGLDELSIKTDGIQADQVAFKADTFEKFTNVDNGLDELSIKTDGIQADQVAFKASVFESQSNVAGHT